MTERLLLTELKLDALLRFNSVLKLTLGLLLGQLALGATVYNVNVYLFIAPLIYLFVCKQNYPTSTSIKLQFLHFSFLAVLSWFLLFLKAEFYLLIHALYLFSYCLLIQYRLKVNLGVKKFHSSNLFVSFCLFYLSVCALILVIDFVDVNFIKVFDFNYQFLFLGMLLTMICFSFYLLYRQHQLGSSSSSNLLSSLNGNEALVVKQEPDREEIILKIQDFFEKSDLYLHANFTLEDLSVVLQVPRGLLSDVMNKEMSKGFYAILGEHRIHYAKKILLTQDHFTIEALVYQCGFHSKSTFNKYFKEFVGQTPSSFRTQNMLNVKVL